MIAIYIAFISRLILAHFVFGSDFSIAPGSMLCWLALPNDPKK